MARQSRMHEGVTNSTRHWFINNSVSFGFLLIGIGLYVASFLALAITGSVALSSQSIDATQILSSIFLICIVALVLSSFTLVSDAIAGHKHIATIRALAVLEGIVLLIFTASQLSSFVTIMVVIGFVFSYLSTIFYSP